MNLFSNPRAKRRTAFAILVGWSFALSAAWANACILQQLGTHAHGLSGNTSGLVQAAVISAGHVGADTAHHEASGAAKGACLKVCDDATRAVVKPAPAGDPSDAGFAPAVTSTWTAHPVAHAPDRSMLELPSPRPSLPLRTRYSRLAL
ncbi:MAG: hypothetical protein WA210_01540 [Burkholderiaceae bacterium]